MDKEMKAYAVTARISGIAHVTVMASSLEEAEIKANRLDFDEPADVEWEYREIRSVEEA